MTSQIIANACGFVLSLSMLSPHKSSSSSSSAVEMMDGKKLITAEDSSEDLVKKPVLDCSSYPPTEPTLSLPQTEPMLTFSTTTTTSKSLLQEKNDHHARTFWLIRILYVSYYASTGVIVPFLSIYYRSLGHGGNVIGLLSALRPLINVLVAPIWGMLADFTGDTLGMLRIAAVFSTVGYIATGIYSDVTSLILAVVFTSVFYAPVRSLMDSLVLEKLAEMTNDNSQLVVDESKQNTTTTTSSSSSNKGTEQFGKLRLWGPIGYGLGCSFAGMVVTNQINNAATVPPMITTESAVPPRSLQIMALQSLRGAWNSMTGYRIVFGIFAAMSVPMLATLWAFPSSKRQPAKAMPKQPSSSVNNNNNNNNNNDKEGGISRILQGLSALVHNQDALLFFFLVFVIGINYGGIETFCYVRMREVGATGQQIGMSRLLCALSGTPMFWLSGHLKRWFKAEQVLVLSLMGFMARFVVYALIRTPLDALPAESIRGIAFAAFYSTASTYVHQLSPPGLNSTMLMLMNAVHGGFGQSVGSILAGKLQSQIGTSQTFLLMAYMNAAFIILIVIYLTYFRGMSSTRRCRPKTL